MESQECPNHEWVVFSTASLRRWLMLQCVNCEQLANGGSTLQPPMNGAMRFTPHHGPTAGLTNLGSR